MKRIDLTGQRFGRLTVIRYDHTENGYAFWLCRCDCGNETLARSSCLKSNYKKSCGCLKTELMQEKAENMRKERAEKQRPDLTGKKFGMLTPIKPVKTASWLCQCDCGNTVIETQGDLLSGRRKSCGCGPKGMKRSDIGRTRYGKLTIIRRNEDASAGLNNVVYDCLCDCGNEITVYKRMLLSGKITSCGCDGKNGQTKRIVNEDFSRRHGCNICADRKQCDMTFCKYEGEIRNESKG